MSFTDEEALEALAELESGGFIAQTAGGEYYITETGRRNDLAEEGFSKAYSVDIGRRRRLSIELRDPSSYGLELHARVNGDLLEVFAILLQGDGLGGLPGLRKLTLSGPFIVEWATGEVLRGSHE